MRTLEQTIDDCAELTRNKRKAAEYFRNKFGKEKDYQELLEAAEEHEQFVKWLMELKRYRESVGYSGKLERKE